MNFYGQQPNCENLKFEIIKLSDYNSSEVNDKKCDLNNLFAYSLIFLLVCYVLYSVYDYLVNNTDYLNNDDEEEVVVDKLQSQQVQPQQVQPQQVQPQQLQLQQLQLQNQVDQQLREQQLLDKYNQLLELQKQINDLMSKKQ
jgi:hypothetical protein